MYIPKFSFRLSQLFVAVLISFSFAGFARGVSPVAWEIASRAELLRGEARGVSITDTGAIVLAPRVAQVFDTGQSFVWSSAMAADGSVYLGTGHDGRIFRVGADGKGAFLYKASELDVTALAVGKDGALYAGTSPDGKVYRITSDGKAQVFFDPPEKYIWSLAVLPDGALAVGTGESGKIYRVREAGQKPEAALLAQTNQTHVISLAVDMRGDIIAGTDPGGLVLRVGADGKLFALYDAPLREIHALAVAPDNTIYALALGDAATTARAAATTTSSATTATTTTTAATTTEDASASPQPSRSRSDLTNARSTVFRISSENLGTDVLWSSTTVNAFSLAVAPQGGVLVGTSDKGRIHFLSDAGRDTLLLQSSEEQISTLMVRGRDAFAAASNGGKLFRFALGDPSALVNEGTYESPVRDAKLTAAWGRVVWRGQGAIELQTRSGNTEKPDATWSDWSAPLRDPANANVMSPRARFIQWRAVLRGGATGQSGDAAARVETVRLYYLPRNVAPEVLSISVLPTGVALQPAIQVPADPNIEASGLDPSALGIVQAVAPPRRIFQRGAVSLTWQAEDRNNDELEYSIYYRAVNETTFRLLKDHIRENFYTIDAATLADGRYIFKIVASDAPDNPPSLALTGERMSEEIDVDNTPPVVRALGEAQVANGRVRVRFDADDGKGAIKRADVSLDGGAWRPVFPEDGIADSPHETYMIDLPLPSSAAAGGEHTVALRVYDASANVGSARIRFVVNR